MEWSTIGIIFIILIMIITIIVIIILNRQNTFNIIESLPSYRIYYPKGDQYVSLFNKRASLDQNLQIGTAFYAPILITSKNPVLERWAFKDASTAAFNPVVLEGTKIVKWVNQSFFAVTPLGPVCSQGPNKTCPDAIIGFVGAQVYIEDPSAQVNHLAPTLSDIFAPEFLYTSMENNQFTLKIHSGQGGFYDGFNVFVNKNNDLIVDKTTEPSVFQLQPLLLPTS